MKWGIADRSAYKAIQMEKEWQQTGEVDQLSLAEALSLSERAINWAPKHPDYLDLNARMLIMNYLFTRQPSVAESARQQLLDSRQIRPAWPGNWATYIELKHHLGEADPELSGAIVEAASYGPWEPALVQAITRAGTATYGTLTPEAQDVVVSTISRGLSSPVARLPVRTRVLVEREAQGWTTELVQQLIGLLIEESWTRKSKLARSQLALTLWPLMSRSQKDSITIHLAVAIQGEEGSQVLRALRPSSQLIAVCTQLPRTQQYQRLCSRALKQKTRL